MPLNAHSASKMVMPTFFKMIAPSSSWSPENGFMTSLGIPAPKLGTTAIEYHDQKRVFSFRWHYWFYDNGCWRLCINKSHFCIQVSSSTTECSLRGSTISEWQQGLGISYFLQMYVFLSRDVRNKFQTFWYAGIKSSFSSLNLIYFISRFMKCDAIETFFFVFL